jgi:hypothetical protein
MTRLLYGMSVRFAATIATCVEPAQVRVQASTLLSW